MDIFHSIVTFVSAVRAPKAHGLITPAEKTHDYMPCIRCGKAGLRTCGHCKLVVYCSRKCVLRHWRAHRHICNDDLLEKNWKPTLLHEKRKPSIPQPDEISTSPEPRKYLLGNMPALDILKLSHIEGEDYDEATRLLFAASGDLRNVVETTAGITPASTKHVSAHINDGDMTVVARNIILTLMAMSADDEDGIDCMFHLWYSAMITNEHWTFLQTQIRPMVQDLARTNTLVSPDGDLYQSWCHTDNMACQVTLSKAQWDELLSFFELPIGMTAQHATHLRQAVTTLHDRRDLKESYLYVQKPAHRLCLNKYWEDGVLLSFPASRDPFTIPNPTFFQSEYWPLGPSADPLKGWSFYKIIDFDAGPATNDIYGKLYVHIRQRLQLFKERLQAELLKFTFSFMDARDLHTSLPEGSFDRIEASNISDDNYMGMRVIAEALAPLLRHPNDNPHATPITLFMNAVASVAKHIDGNPGVQLAKIKRASEYLRTTWVLDEHDPELYKLKWAADLVRPKDASFNRYMEGEGFDSIAKNYDLQMKNAHTIIKKWPLGLVRQPGVEGAKEELLMLMASGHSGNERYVEWRRTCGEGTVDDVGDGGMIEGQDVLG